MFESVLLSKTANRKVQGVPQSQTAANLRHQEEEKNDKNLRPGLTIVSRRSAISIGKLTAVISQTQKNETTNEPRHDKTNKVTMRPAKTQINLGIRPVWSESSLTTWRNIEPLVTQLSAQRRLRWAHSHFVGFVMSRLKSWSE